MVQALRFVRTTALGAILSCAVANGPEPLPVDPDAGDARPIAMDAPIDVRAMDDRGTPDVRDATEPDAVIDAPADTPPDVAVDDGTGPDTETRPGCGETIVLRPVSGSYTGTLNGRTRDFSTCNASGPDVVYELTIPPGATRVDVCARSTSFTPLLVPGRTCGIPDCTACCITDEVDAPCDGSACSNWGNPPGGTTIYYTVTSTCDGTCGCPGGAVAGDFTLQVRID